MTMSFYDPLRPTALHLDLQTLTFPFWIQLWDPIGNLDKVISIVCILISISPNVMSPRLAASHNEDPRVGHHSNCRKV